MNIDNLFFLKLMKSKPNFGFPTVVWKSNSDLIQHGREWLQKQEKEDRNPIFWSRIGGQPNFQGAKVLEIGCGFGRFSIEIALAGAAKVVGLDIEPKDIQIAQMNLQENYPQVKDIVQFESCRLESYEDYNFDYIVSQNTFEHVDNLSELLAAAKIRLVDGGLLYSGFGPLWNSPFGFHGDFDDWNFNTKYPWGHLLVNRSNIVDSFNKSQDKTIENLQGIGMNGLHLSDYRDICYNSGMEVVKFQINHQENLKSRVFSVLGKLPGLQEYFTHQLYIILKKQN